MKGEWRSEGEDRRRRGDACALQRETENQDSVITEGGAKIWVMLRCRDAERTAATTAAHH